LLSRAEGATIEEMKTSCAVTFAAALLLVSGASNAATHKFTGALTAAKELPVGSVVSTATGAADLTFDDVTRKLTGSLTFTGLHDTNDAVIATAFDARYHKGGAAVSSSDMNLIADLAAGSATPSPIAVDVTLAMADVADLMAGNTFINVSSNKYQGGEVRGQLVESMGVDAGAGDGGTASDAGAATDSGTTDTTPPPADTPPDNTPPDNTSGGIETPADAGDTAAPEEGSGGCSTSGSGETTGGLMLGLLAGLGIVIAARARKRR
jgi:hypothetical protein